MLRQAQQNGIFSIISEGPLFRSFGKLDGLEPVKAPKELLFRLC